jgi:DnaJ-class molecular chaperone
MTTKDVVGVPIVAVCPSCRGRRTFPFCIACKGTGKVQVVVTPDRFRELIGIEPKPTD